MFWSRFPDIPSAVQERSFPNITQIVVALSSFREFIQPIEKVSACRRSAGRYKLIVI